jgi:hypothetical protein
MRSLVALFLCVTLFTSTLIAQTGIPKQAPQSSQPQTRAANFDDVWASDRVGQDGKHFVAYFLLAGTMGGRLRWCTAQDVKTCVAGTSYAGYYTTNYLTATAMKFLPVAGNKLPAMTITQTDTDHLQSDGGFVYQRTHPRPEDARCDAGNSARMTADYAFLRGKTLAQEHRDLAAGSCWLHISAQEGNPTGEAFVAYMAHEGIGEPRDLPKALRWAQKSAHAGDNFGIEVLGGMYEANQVPNANPAEAKVWIDKAHRLMAQERQQQGGAANAQATQRAFLGVLMAGVIAAILGGGGAPGVSREDAEFSREERGVYEERQREAQDEQHQAERDAAIPPF